MLVKIWGIDNFYSSDRSLKQFGIETKIYPSNDVSTMAVDALHLCIVRSSAAMAFAPFEN